jgi:streptogramin lyase/anti-sigma factor RsiW
LLDDELSDAERRQARRHIGTCERCSAELASFGRIDSVLASPPAIDCAGALPLLSSRHDRELSLAETLVAEAHIAHCAACRAASSAWAGLDDAISALPVALPSRRVDAAILALGAEKSRPQTGRGIVTGIALRGAVAICLVLAVAVAALQQPARPQIATQTPTVAEQQPVAQLPPITRTQALVASAQQVVLNPKTNTLYVAHPDEGTVGAFNATSLADIATIEVGGRPSALALNEAANTVLVLDTGQKTLTEIDSKTNTVLGTTTLNVAGSPNAIQVDPANGRIVVAVSDPPQSQAATPSGTVVVLDSTSKKLETTRNVPVAARQVVLDEHGQRALLVSEDVVTVVEAATYRPLDQLPGGVAAAFAARGSSTAVLSVAAGSSRVTIAGDQNATLSLFGMPVAIVALPNGGFAVLVDEEGHGRITEIAPDGSPGRSVNVDLVGRELTYNAATGNYAVAGSGGIVFATTTAGQVAVMPPAPTINAQPPTSSNGTAAAPSSAPASAPTSVVPAQTAATERQPNLPQGVTLAWPGTYRFDLVGRAAPEVVGRGHAGHLWFVDAANRLTSVDAVTGAAYTIYELPKDARIRSIEVGSSYVYAIDVAASRVYVVSLPSEQVSVSALPFVKSSAAVAVTPDDRLWFAVADQILTLDPRNGKIEAANIGAYGVGAMTADSAGRVWFSDESQKLIGMYDRATSTVTELALPRRGTLTAMVVDSSGTLWAGSDAGELFAVRGGALVVSAKVRGSVRAFALDPIGTAWFLSADGQQASLGQVRSPGAAKTIPATIAGVWFDARSDAWLADRSSAGFFIAVPEAR